MRTDRIRIKGVLKNVYQGQGFSNGKFPTLPPPTSGHLAKSRDMVGITAWRLGEVRESYCHLGAKGLGAAKHPTMPRTVSYSKELSGPKCQWCQG